MLNAARIEKNRGKYSFFNNLLYHYKNLFRWEPGIFWVGFFMIIPGSVALVAGDYLPAVLVEGLEQGWPVLKLFGMLLVILLIICMGNVLDAVCFAYCLKGTGIYRQHYSSHYVEKRMKVDYEVLEQQDFQACSNIAYTAIYQGRGIMEATSQLPSFLSLMGGVVFYGIMLCRINVWIMVLALGSSVVQVRLLKLAREKHSKAYPILAAYSKRMNYITEQTMESAAGKDIRMYRMADWLLGTYKKNLDAMNHEYYHIHNWYMLKNASDAVFDLIRNGAAYLYLVYMVTAGRLSLAEFVLYFGFVNSFANSMFKALRMALSFGIIGNTFGSMREYFDTLERKTAGRAMPEEEFARLQNRPARLELKNVSFTYPGQDQPTISHLSLTIEPEEKLALIGLNGAGKTTLVKLICGFYVPTEGEILFDGINIQEFDREQYYRLVSVLFQDYTILPVTVDENITAQAEDRMDREKLRKCLTKANFEERYDQLPEGGKSLLVKEVHEGAADFSGGEKQKLLLARALYKEAPLLILDEPTAALDPIAENEVYLQYGEAARGKTSIYISHRLSSTRFCDRIVLLQDGRLVEEGTHESLMQAGGIYAELFEMQSKYYREQEKEEKWRRVMEEA